jgi:hypothetical protein
MAGRACVHPGRNGQEASHNLAAVVQVCLNAAQQQERDVAAKSAAVAPQSSSSSDPGLASPGSAGDGRPAASAAAVAAPSGRPASADLTCPVATLNDLLASYAELGYAPSGLMLQALAPSICRQLPTTPAPQVLRLLELLAVLGVSPGPAALGLMLARIQDDAAAATPTLGLGAGSGVAGVGEDMLQLGRALVEELGGELG